MVGLRTDSRRIKEVVAVAAMVLIFLNIFVFAVGSTYLGGDALYGYVRGSHYFVCAHGKCNEVSRSVWLYSYWQAITALTGWILFVLALFIWKFVAFLCKKSGHDLYGDA